MSLLARFSLANRGLVALIAVVITGFGLFAVPSLKQQLLPSMEFPGAFVIATYPGAAPEIVESQVTEPIENSLQGISGLKKVTSTSRESVATIQVEYEFGTDLDAAVNKMQTALSRIDAQLPDNVDPMVLTGSTDDLPAVVLAAGGGGDERALADKLKSTVVPELEAIDGVRTVEVTGAREQTVVIVPDPVKLARAGVQPTAIASALQTNGVAIPAGTIIGPDRSLTVQVGTRINSIEELRGIFLTPAPGAAPAKPGTAPVKLGDIATVEQKLAEPTGFTRTNGKESLGISITATPDGNAVEISREIRDRLAGLRTASGAELNVVFDQAPFVEKSIESLTTEGLLGLVMAVLVILVFLLSVRSTLVTAVSIPLSVVVALLALWIGDYSLNLLTLGALTIAVGRVVDDSIVVLENIKRHLGYGERKRDAINRGVREVAGAVTASTLTTVAVFAPIALVGGFVGQIFAPFAITVTVALLASLLVSLTVIPVLAYWFLKPAAGGEVDEEAVRRAAEEKELRDPLQRRYLPVIEFATRRRWLTVGLGLLVLIGTFGLSTGLKTNFLDQSGQDTLSITQEMPVGTSLTATDAAARKVEEVLARTKGVKTYQVTVGGGGMPWESGGSKSSFSVALDADTDAEELTEQLRGEFKDRTDIGEVRFGGGGGQPGAGSTNQLAVIVQATDPEVLARATEQARQALADTPEVKDVTTNLTGNTPRIEVTVDRAAAARVGMSEAAVGQLVAQAFRGSPVGRVVLDGEQQDVVLRFGAGGPTSIEALRALPVGPVKLDDIAEISEVKGPLEVTRIDGDRSATVTGMATGSNLGKTTTALKERLGKLDVPGATFTVGGVSADQEEAFADLGLAVLAAIAIVFLIMVATFRSLIQPLILLVSIPFAATGAIGLLLATGTPLGVPALIGVLMLVGIVVTNAIVLLDLINQYRDQGMGVREAVIEGGRRRLRPILMTAIATIFALLPMAFGLTGEGGFISQPLAIVVIGGLISSTLLTLVLVPTLYTMVENTKERIRQRRVARGAGQAAGAVESDRSPADAGRAAAAANGGTTAGSPSEDGPDRVESPASVATTTEARPAPSGALIDGTDQFEVLRLPKSRRSPLPPAE
ncbi:efflux RND transporter permease subunit [Micromonospora sonneratiae]|uniref:Efflux RND transporter permease subunit n=1 Tax=Micromonospora sonneratiae TaxID=1184706 RepID=A0ABW3YQA9_9ACTN